MPHDAAAQRLANLSLDCLTLTDTPPIELVEAAAAAGFRRISLWVQAPAPFPRQLATAAMLPSLADALDAHAVAVHGLEVFDLVSREAVESYRPALELGARLGAGTATAINLRNPDRAELIDLLAQFRDTAREYSLQTLFEPIAPGHVRTLAEARDLIAQAGGQIRITLDFLHLIRTGCGLREMAAIDPDLIGHVQICDGPLAVAPEQIWVEASRERAYPGDGEFPLRQLLAAIPPAASLGIETPSLRRHQAGVSARDQALAAMAAMQGIMAG
jgi:sugar phosphate isomerase/epimerase